MAEREEGLWMSAKERDRLKVLHEVRKRHIPQRQAAAELGISVRWVRTLLKRLRVHGDGGLRHRLRGRRSNHKTPEELQRRAVELFRQNKQARLWHDYGPTLAAEELSYGGHGEPRWNEPMCGERGERAMANWCNGTPVNTTGSKDGVRSST